MELGTQIKKHRQALDWSQETLAEKTFVSRQTISNWENDKSYPDIQSLLLLSTLFDVSLDQLVKGDVEIMKEQISKEDVKSFNRSAWILTALFLIMVLSAVPLVFHLWPYGAVAWGVIVAIALGYGFYVEREKKRYDIHTYREILAFMNGEPVDEIRKERDRKKLFRQRALALVISGMIGALCALLSYWLFIR